MNTNNKKFYRLFIGRKDRTYYDSTEVAWTPVIGLDLEERSPLENLAQAILRIPGVIAVRIEEFSINE